MATTVAVAVHIMAKARFDATSFTLIDDVTEHGPIGVPEDDIAKVAATFKTTQYGGEPAALP